MISKQQALDKLAEIHKQKADRKKKREDAEKLREQQIRDERLAKELAEKHISGIRDRVQ